jgi:hypothetical protein
MFLIIILQIQIKAAYHAIKVALIALLHLSQVVYLVIKGDF